MSLKRGFLLAMGVLMFAATAATPAEAQYRHHRHRHCYWRHHHRVCRYY